MPGTYIKYLLPLTGGNHFDDHNHCIPLGAVLILVIN
jgi:hypothetical protein